MSLVSQWVRVGAALLAGAAFALPQNSASPPPDTFKPAPQEQFVSYWTADPGWHTELMLRNNLESAALSVTPSLRLASGAEAALAAVSIPPSSVVSLNLHEALLQSHPELLSQANAYGSVVLRYTALSLSNLYASAMIHDDGFPIVYHLDGTAMEPDSGRGTHEGIWWLPKPATKGYLILTNMSPKEQSGVLWLSDQAGHTSQQSLTLAAGETLRFPLPELLSGAGLSGTQGGVSFRMNRGAGTVDTALLLYDEPAGFSALMKMFFADPSVTLKSHDFAGTAKWTTRAPLLALEHPDPALELPADAVLHPRLFLRNTTDRPVKAQLSLHWRSAQSDGRVALPEMTLTAEETRVIDIQQLQESGVVPAAAWSAQPTLATDTLPNEVMAVAASYDETLRYGAQTPFSDQLAFHFEGSAWQVDATHDSIIAAGNGSARPVKARLTFFYAGGAHKYELEQTIAPDDELLVDVGKLIRDRIPDKNGNLFPGDLTTGAYQLRDLAETPAASLYEGKVVTDKTWGHATYGCAVCCGYRAAYFNPDPSGVGVAENSGVDAIGLDACSSGTAIVSGYATSWTSGNTSILTAEARQITGVSLGTTGHYAQLTNIMYGPARDANPCPLQDVPVGGTGNVNPTIQLNQTTITTQQPGSIEIGAPAALTLKTGGASLSSASWTVGGTTIAAGPPAGSAPSSPNFNQISPTFYWVPTYYGTSSMPTSWSAAISVSGTLSNGQTASASANVTVLAPSVSVAATNGKTIIVDSSSSAVGAECGDSDTTYCMQLVPSVVHPPSGPTGNFQWVQVIDADSYTYTITSGTQYSCSLGMPLPALDSKDPYPDSTNSFFRDSPSLMLNPTSLQSMTINESFSAVLMWQPGVTNSTWVPLSSTNWSWGATVSLSNGNWTLSSATYPNAQVLYGGYWPVWYSTAVGQTDPFTCH